MTSGQVPGVGLPRWLIAPFLATVQRVGAAPSRRPGGPDLRDIPLALITITVRGGRVAVPDGSEFELDGSCDVITPDLDETTALKRPRDGAMVSMPREAAGMIFAVLFMSSAREGTDIPADARAAITGMLHVARYAAYHRHPELARQFLDGLVLDGAGSAERGRPDRRPESDRGTNRIMGADGADPARNRPCA